MKKEIQIFALGRTIFAACFSLLLLVGCEKDDLSPASNEGEVTFVFKKNAVYSLNSLLDVASVKFVVSDGLKNDTLPSMKVSGTADSLATPAFKLTAGNYRLLSYRLFAADASQIYEASVKEGESFEVKPGVPTSLVVPADVYVQISTHPLKNILLGICLETFGPDQSLWPWSNDVSVYEWEGLDFDPDYGFVTGIVFDERFKNLKRLPESIDGITTLENIHISDCNLESLPDALETMNVRNIFLSNTKLSALKPSFFRQKRLNALFIQNSPLKEISNDLGNLKELYVLHLAGLPINELPASVGDLPKLESLYLIGCQVASLPASISNLPNLHQLELANNPLSTLPASINQMPILRTLNLNGCKFTTFPSALKNNGTIRSLLLKGNPISAFSAGELGTLSNLSSLNISETGISNLSALTVASVPELQELVMAKCNLATAPAIPALPKLISLSLEGNNLVSMPADFFPLVDGKSTITSLVLKGNKLTSLPAGFGVVNGMVNLTFVDLSNNPQLVWTIPEAWKLAKVYVNSNNTQVIK